MHELLLSGEQRTITELPVLSSISLLPLLVTSSAPATTPACGTLSRSCSSFRRATTVRGRPRTTDLAYTQSWRSPLKSIRHGVCGHGTPPSLSCPSARAAL